MICAGIRRWQRHRYSENQALFIKWQKMDISIHLCLKIFTLMSREGHRVNLCGDVDNAKIILLPSKQTLLSLVLKILQSTLVSIQISTFAFF